MNRLILHDPRVIGPLLVAIINIIFTAVFNYFNNKLLIKKIYKEDGNKKRIELYDENFF